MRIKNHPLAIVEVYVDGRAEAFFPNTKLSFGNAITIGLITGLVKKLSAEAPREELPPGRYEAHLKAYNWFTKYADFELKPVQ